MDLADQICEIRAAESHGFSCHGQTRGRDISDMAPRKPRGMKQRARNAGLHNRMCFRRESKSGIIYLPLQTAVSYMAGNGAASMLELALSFEGVDSNLPDNEGNTPLHFAAQAGE